MPFQSELGVTPRRRHVYENQERQSSENTKARSILHVRELIREGSPKKGKSASERGSEAGEKI